MLQGIASLISTSCNAYDANAAAFITATGITDTTQKNAINGLVKDLKANNFWVGQSKALMAFYPCIGGTYDTIKYNLMDPRDLDAAYRLSTSDATYNNDGIIHTPPHGRTYLQVYGDDLNQNSVTMFFNTPTNVVENVTDMGYQGDSGQQVYVSLYGGNFAGNMGEFYTGGASYTQSYTAGFYLVTRTASNLTTLYKNGNSVATSTGASIAGSHYNISIGAFNNVGVNYGGSTKRYNTFGIANVGFTSTDASNLYTILEKFNTALGRVILDPDANAFITAAGLTNPVEISSIRQLVRSAKNNGWWDKCSAIYPFVGRTASSCKYNLKNPLDTNGAFRITWSGNPTFSSNGVLFDGSNYGDTNFNELSSFTFNNLSLGAYYVPSAAMTNKIMMGAYSSGSSAAYITIGNGTNVYLAADIYGYSGPEIAEYTGASTSGGFVVADRSSGTRLDLYYNGTSVSNNTGTTTSTGLPNLTVFIGKLNGALGFDYVGHLRFAFMGLAMSSTIAAAMYKDIQLFQTALERQIYDSDALAFINAAGITNSTEKSAIDILVSSAKAHGWWTLCDAIYPFVGGTSTTCKYNLKDPRDLDAAFRLNFVGGWAFASTGVTPTSTYADTFLIPINVMSSANDVHISIYSRTALGGGNGSYGSSGSGSVLYPVAAISYQGGFASDSTPSSLAGYYIGSRISSTDHQIYENGVSIGSNTGANTAPLSDYTMLLGAYNYIGAADGYSNNEQAFTTIGRGVSSTIAALMYTDIQAFQTTLGRNV